MSQVAESRRLDWGLPALDAAAVDELRANGIMSRLKFASRGVHAIDGYAEIMQMASQFNDSERVANAYADYAAGRDRGGLKPFLVKYADHQDWTADSPMIRFAMQPEILGTVAYSLGIAPLLLSADIWLVMPSEGKQRIWSQSWHRDPEDDVITKVMLYLNDVDEETGPFEYVVQSHVRDWEVCEPRRYPSEQLAVPMERARKYPGPAGTLLFANTAGLHRGGYGTKPRLTATWMFCSPNSRSKAFQLPSPPAWAGPEQLYSLGFQVPA